MAAPRWLVTVDQAAIAEDRPAVHVHDTWTGERANTACFDADGRRVVVRQLAEPAQDGARVVMEVY